MDAHQHRKEIIEGISEQLSGVFGKSSQGIYIYLDDVHKACNRKFSSMLGYPTPAKWASVEDSFPKFVAEKSRRTLISAYRTAMEKKDGSVIEVSWNKLGGGIVKTQVMLVPIAYKGHMLALHFVEKI